MVDWVDQLGDLAVKAAQIRGARVSLKLNAWPGEIPIADAADLNGTGGPGLIRAQVIVRDSSGRTITTAGSDIQQNWFLTAAVLAGLGLLAVVLVRGVLPKKGK